MRLRIHTCARFFLAYTLLISFLLPHAVPGQTAAAQTPPATTTPQDEVLRINTSLVQTDVIVLDKNGRSVKGLPKEQFELLVDGQPQEISFFENVETGSLRESAQIVAARGTGGTTTTPTGIQPAGATLPPSPSAGRSFIFFIDDFHLNPMGIQRARDLLNNFFKDMGEDDQALVISPSGQIGFLQQLTDNKAALKLAASRIKYQAQTAPFTSGRRQMSVYEALAIERNQRNILDYKTKEYMDDMGLTRAGTDTPSPVPRSSGPGGAAVEPPRVSGTDLNNRKMSAEMAVKGEARAILEHANRVTEAVLGSLDFVARGAGTLPGRKLFFFISDGFVLDTRSQHNTERLQRVIDTAARSGVAIYTVDAKGLTIGNVDASKDVFSDIAVGSAVTPANYDASTDASSISFGEDAALKEILRTIAADTGGRAILNRNDLESGIKQLIQETESYYVLAWRPQMVDTGKPKYTTLKVGIKGRPELRVLSRGGFYSAPPPPLPSDNKTVVAKDSKGAPLKPSEAELRAAISSAFPRRQLGVSAYTSYSNESGDAYKVVTFADLSNYQVATPGGKGGEVDFYVALLSSEGKSVTSVGQKVSITESSRQPFRIAATLPNTTPPGLYQVRVAARDALSGRVGSFYQWLEIPAFKPGELAVSNPLLAEITGKAGETPSLAVERRFSRKSELLIQMFIYHASRAGGGAGAPDVTVTMQVLQGGKQIIASPPQPLQTTGVADMTRLPYGAQIPLSRFVPGRYTLRLTATDRTAKTTASQQLNFTIE